jgi:hypothetical protein
MAFGLEPLGANFVDDRRQQQVALRVVVDLKGFEDELVVFLPFILNCNV